MADNPLVAAPVDTATPFSGAGLVSDGADLVNAIKSGDWVAGGMAAFSAAIDTAATVSDPLGSLIAAGLGWLMDHLEPLKGWLNDLTGDAGEVEAFSQTWANISQQLSMSGQELARIVDDLQSQAGETIEAYRRFQKDAGQHIDTAGQLAGAFSTGLGIASMIVQVVHDLVRDAIAQIVGSAISWAAEAVFSLGLATPWIIEQVSTRVSALVTKIGTKLTDLLKSVKELKSLLTKADEILQKLKKIFDQVFRNKKVVPGRTDGKTVPYRDWKARLKDSQHNPDADRAMLGSYRHDPVTGGPAPDSYNVRAGTDHRYFDMGSTWGDYTKQHDLTDRDMFELFNRPFLDKAAHDHLPIDFSHDPVNIDPGRALHLEYQDLISRGYTWDPTTMTMTPPRR